MSQVDDAADQLVKNMRESYAQLTGGTTSGLINTVEGWFSSSQQQQVSGAIAAISPLIDKWAGPHRKWAQNGQRDDGSTFTWDMWTDEGKVIADDISAQGGYFAQASSFQAVVDASAQTLADVGSTAAGALEGLGGFLLSPWTWGIGASLLGILVLGPYAVPYIKRFAKAVKS